MGRLGIILAISFVFAFAFNEVTYRLQKEPTDRAPQVIQLIIPQGTAQLVAAGEPVPDIPAEMVFVVGDVLEVINQDRTSHQLGPVWVPAGSTGRLVMDRAENVRYSCSFQDQQYLGLETRPPTTFTTRLTALFLTVPTLAVVLFLYSVAAMPVKKQEIDHAPSQGALQ
jgi:hypothetical protein